MTYGLLIVYHGSWRFRQTTISNNTLERVCYLLDYVRDSASSIEQVKQHLSSPQSLTNRLALTGTQAAALHADDDYTNLTECTVMRAKNYVALEGPERLWSCRILLPQFLELLDRWLVVAAQKPLKILVEMDEQYHFTVSVGNHLEVEREPDEPYRYFKALVTSDTYASQPLGDKQINLYWMCKLLKDIGDSKEKLQSIKKHLRSTKNIGTRLCVATMGVVRQNEDEVDISDCLYESYVFRVEINSLLDFLSAWLKVAQKKPAAGIEIKMDTGNECWAKIAEAIPPTSRSWFPLPLYTADES